MQALQATEQRLPGHALQAEKMPGHWLLARLGKRVLRPGGLALTRWLIDSLRISRDDEIVEFAPGFGITAKLALEHHPQSYTGVERDSAAAAHVVKILDPAIGSCTVGRAEESGLASRIATIVVAEAMLSMQPNARKAQIVGEAARVLKPHGRYAIHELCIRPDDISPADRAAIEEDFSQAIHVGVKPLTVAEWHELLSAHGFAVVAEKFAPMHLLRPLRILRDEGLLGCVRMLANVVRDRAARQRVRQMRRVFRRHRKHLSAIALIATRVESSR
jgi:SAM-dependent methyltransferase